MKEYDPLLLRRVQQTELTILKDFIALCEEHGLTYFAFAGTGIGALRHKGFIPWDDDIDVGLPRADYEAFLRIAKEEYGDRYFVVNAEEEENFPLMTTRWCKRNTVFVEESLKDIDCPLGVFLDIYAFDTLPDDDRALRRQARSAWLWSKLLILRSIPHPVLPVSGWKARVLQTACAAVYYGMRVFGISKRWLYRKCRAASMRHLEASTGRIGYLCDTNPYSHIIEVEELNPPLRLEFEGEMVCFPRCLRKMLENTYGDYMQLPPEEQRKNHCPFALQLEEDMSETTHA